MAEGLVKYKVKPETLERANRCIKKHSCVLEHDGTVCEIECAPTGEVLFVYCKDRHLCNYQMGFGEGVVCTCPVRKEIFKEYGE